jgi:hypothetical protein
MRYELRPWVSLTVLVVALFGSHPLAQTRAPASPIPKRPTATKTWSPPRTPDGQPDLQGIWLNNSATPLERPPQLAGKPLLTDAEVAELQQRADRLFRNQDADAAGGDNFFLALLANPDHYTNPNATGGQAVDRPLEHRTSLITDPMDGKIPWTPEGQQRQAAAIALTAHPTAADPEDLTNGIRCLTFGTPRIAGNYAVGNFGYVQIVQTSGYVVLSYEWTHEVRIIPLDRRPHLPETIREWRGDARGHWEADTLVVETGNFSSKSFFQGSSDRLHLVERFTRVAPDRLDYQVTFDDPTTWTRSWTALVHLAHRDENLYEVACHEGNLLVVKGVLDGARAKEHAVERSQHK